MAQARTSATTRSRKPKSGAAERGRHVYLLAFNVLSCLAWLSILISLVTHLSASSAFSIIPDRWRSTWAILYNRAATLHAGLGPTVTIVQTAALLEPLHAILGLVKSNPVTSSAQVASRLFIVHFILSQFPAVGASPFYASMVFAWSLTEVIRFATYTAGLLAIKAPRLEWLRYTAWLPLYPLGAGSEAALIYLALPYAGSKYHHQGWFALVGLLTLWPVALAVLMSHMAAQRRKHIGSAKSRGKKRA